MSDWTEVGGGDGADMWDRQGSVQGVYTTSRSGVGPNKSMVYTLKTDKGEIGVWGSTVLDSKFEQIERGSEVKVTSLGKAKSQTGKEYNDFKVEVKPVEDVAEGTENVIDTLGGEVI